MFINFGLIVANIEDNCNIHSEYRAFIELILHPPNTDLVFVLLLFYSSLLIYSLFALKPT